jgi:hypothetical protein
MFPMQHQDVLHTRPFHPAFHFSCSICLPPLLCRSFSLQQSCGLEEMFSGKKYGRQDHTRPCSFLATVTFSGKPQQPTPSPSSTSLSPSYLQPVRTMTSIGLPWKSIYCAALSILPMGGTATAHQPPRGRPFQSTTITMSADVPSPT